LWLSRGAKNKVQALENAAAGDIVLTPDEVERLSKISESVVKVHSIDRLARFFRQIVWVGVRLVALLLFRRDLSHRLPPGSGRLLNAQRPFPAWVARFNPPTHTPRRFRRLMAIVWGRCRFCGVAPGLPARLSASRRPPRGRNFLRSSR
jgi:hypothetical protein